MIRPEHRLALLMQDAVRTRHGKMGFALLRYRPEQVVAVIDPSVQGQSLRALTGIAHDAPIVAGADDAAALGADVLVIAVATSGGILPPEYRTQIVAGLRAGMSLVHPLHGRLADDTEVAAALRPGRFVWDIRVEPPGLPIGQGRAAGTPARRVLTVGTDMAIGKMTASLELDAAARRRGLRSRFLATGQIGICLSGEGIALDAVRVDFASGAVEQLVLRHADNDVVWIEGQGSALHPGSSAWAPLLRGGCPTHLILVHRAGQRAIDRIEHVPIPPFREVVALYEHVARAAGALTPARVVGIALNAKDLDDDEARAAVQQAEAETGLPTADVLRHGADRLLDAVLA